MCYLSDCIDWKYVSLICNWKLIRYVIGATKGIHQHGGAHLERTGVFSVRWSKSSRVAKFPDQDWKSRCRESQFVTTSANMLQLRKEESRVITRRAERAGIVLFPLCFVTNIRNEVTLMNVSVQCFTLNTYRISAANIALREIAKLKIN